MSPCWLSHSKPTGSSLAKLKVMVAVWPAPTTDLLLVMVRVGAWVSMASTASVAALLGLPATSVNWALFMPMRKLPLTPLVALTTSKYHRPWVSGMGSKLTKLALVRARSLALRLSMASLTLTTKLATGLARLITVSSTRVMLTVGAVLSITTATVWLAALPAWSVLVTLTPYWPSAKVDRSALRRPLLSLKLMPVCTCWAALRTTAWRVGVLVTLSLVV